MALKGIQALPDALAFAAGLAMAWWLGWSIADLVWTLWLASLVVGYATIMWTIFRPVTLAWRHRDEVRASFDSHPGLSTMGVLIVLLSGLFMLAFFTVHFGGFHFVHSVFLNGFFPVYGESSATGDIPDLALYIEVFRRYGWFIPLAFAAERAAFAMPVRQVEQETTTPITLDRSTLRKAARKKSGNDAFLAPYRNVIRMHLLIFFFAAASAANLDHFAVYAVVYAVYFFPWRMVVGQAGKA
ncbi:DUF6498-containing protein [Rhodocyclaceae bacterium SMB388]